MFSSIECVLFLYVFSSCRTTCLMTIRVSLVPIGCQKCYCITKCVKLCKIGWQICDMLGDHTCFSRPDLVEDFQSRTQALLGNSPQFSKVYAYYIYTIYAVCILYTIYHHFQRYIYTIYILICYITQFSKVHILHRFALLQYVCSYVHAKYDIYIYTCMQVHTNTQTHTHTHTHTQTKHTF